MKPLIDDIRLPERRPKWGWPVLFTNHDIRKMLGLANATENDIFYDLGCGWGQNLIVALTEFKVKKAIGVEVDKKSWEKARTRLEKLHNPDSWNVIRGEFEDLFLDKIDDVDLSEATIVFYGLAPAKSVLRGLERKLRKNCRLITYFNCLFPEIKYENSNYPFYLSTFPFKKPKSELDWLKTVTTKQRSTLQRKTILADELWKELFHDYEIEGIRSTVRTYKNRLEKFLSNRS
jgi:precorrin-6B methylase 2